MDIKNEALRLHKEHQGKLAVTCKVPLRNSRDLSLAYTPGVAEPCKEIAKNKDLSLEYTCRGNMVAIVSDGTRVLGLGDIGPEAAMPVMEGKAVLFKAFGDVDAVPICLDTKDPETIIKTVRLLQPSFAGINLEDLSSPKCYDIEDRLKEIMDIPVFHDDQHGTAIACLSGVLGALRLVKKDMKQARFVVNGCGAAGTAIGRLLVTMGAGELIMVDQFGALYEDMQGVELNRIQQQLAKTSNRKQRQGTLAEVVQGADVLIGVSAPGVFTADIIRSMAKEAVVFALANPIPETTYEEGKKAGARVVGTGRSDAPNQVNNVNVFPGVFRGALDVRASQITENMKIAAVHAIAGLIEDKDLREDYVIPDAFNPAVAKAVAAAVAQAAIQDKVARKLP